MGSQGHVVSAPPYSSKEPINLIMGSWAGGGTAGALTALIQPPRVTRALGMLSAPAPLKYPQQETAISHQHAKTAVTSQHQGGT